MLKKILTIVVLLLLSSSGYAGGLYLYEVGVTEVALAGAGFAARADDAMTVFTNPAGMTRLDGRQLEVTVMPIFAQVDFNPDAATNVPGSSGDANAVLPGAGVYYSQKINDKMAWGVSFGGYFGSALDYDDDWVGRYYIDEVTLQAVGLQPAFAYKVSDKLSLGAGIVFLYGLVDETVAVNNPEPGLGDGKLVLDDKDLSFQFNLGLLYEFDDDTRVGIQYLSEGDLDFGTNTTGSDFGPVISAIIDRAGLADTDLDLGFTLPQSLMFSMYNELNEDWAIMGNIGWQDWSEFGKVGVSFDDPESQSVVANRNYDDTWHIALGAQRMLENGWEISMGIAYDSSMVETEFRSLDLPVGDNWRFGIGARLPRSENFDIKFGYELLWSGDLPLDVNRGRLSGRVSGEFTDTATHFLGFGISRRF